MSVNSSSYPLKSNESEEQRIQGALEKINKKNLDYAKKVFEDIRNILIRPTGTGDLMLFRSSSAIFDHLKKPVLENVLFVSLRFGWKPEEVLALWTIEGLPTYISLEQFRWWEERLPPAMGWEPIKRFYRESPRNEDEARAWARSIILWDRWGLDILAPVEYHENEQDNRLRVVRKKDHDDSFNKGYNKELSSILSENPIGYLSSKDIGPIELKQSGQEWQFRTKADYQATALAMQHARFKNKEKQIPSEIEKVSLTPPFPALVYIYFNSRIPDKRVKEMIRVLKEKTRKTKKKVDMYQVDDLYRTFVNERIPDEVKNYIEKNCPNKPQLCHSYMNALRFEFLRRVYSVVFDGVLTPFLKEVQYEIR